jgi:hypothetical protein
MDIGEAGVFGHGDWIWITSSLQRRYEMPSPSNKSCWKLAVMTTALIAGATLSLAGLGTSASATQPYAAVSSASTSDRHFVATRPESARRQRYASSRRPYPSARYIPYSRRWRFGKPSEIGYGRPRPTGQYPSLGPVHPFHEEEFSPFL